MSLTDVENKEISKTILKLIEENTITILNY